MLVLGHKECPVMSCHTWPIRGNELRAYGKRRLWDKDLMIFADKKYRIPVPAANTQVECEMYSGSSRFRSAFSFCPSLR